MSRNVYEPNVAATIEIGGNWNAPCLGYTLHTEEVPSLTQRYGPESFSQHVIEHCYEVESLYDVLGQ